METYVIYSAMKLGLFKNMNRTGKPSVDDLAQACQADPTLMGDIAGRVLRFLAAFGAVNQNGPNSYTLANTSQVFTNSHNEAAMEFCFDISSHGWLALPSFLQQGKWQNPTSSARHPLGRAFGKPDETRAWEIIDERPSARRAFNTYMSSFSAGYQQWFDFYPVLDRLYKGTVEEPSAVMMVDVGGGLGHQAISLKRALPELPGRFIVQDLAAGLPNERIGEVEFMEHDFFTTQPIKNARFYYFRYVPRGFSQQDKVSIFTKLREAMKPGYSRLLVNELIVPEIGASRVMVRLDFNLMCNAGGGMERTLALHREYLEKAGLKITNVYNSSDKISESVIEAEVA